MHIQITPQQGRGVFFWSLPQSDEYQIISHIHTPKNIITYNDAYNNNLVSLHPNNSDVISFHLKTKNILKNIPPTFVLQDYKKIPVPSIYFNEDDFINRFDEKISSLTKKVIGTEQRIDIIISLLYRHTLSYLSYANPIDDLYPYSQALDKRQTDCGGYSTFLSSCLQSAGIPTRLVTGFVLTQNFFSTFPFLKHSLRNMFMHAWIEALLPDNSWFPLDPSVEWRRNNELSKRQGGYGEIPADRLVVSYGHELSFPMKDNTYRFQIMQKPLYL